MALASGVGVSLSSDSGLPIHAELFGEGAIPFDVIVSGQGRGTLHVTPNEIRIDTMSRDSTSRPSSSVPSQCAGVPGSARRPRRSSA